MLHPCAEMNKMYVYPVAVAGPARNGELALLCQGRAESSWWVKVCWFVGSCWSCFRLALDYPAMAPPLNQRVAWAAECVMFLWCDLHVLHGIISLTNALNMLTCLHLPVGAIQHKTRGPGSIQWGLPSLRRNFEPAAAKQAEPHWQVFCYPVHQQLHWSVMGQVGNILVHWRCPLNENFRCWCCQCVWTVFADCTV